MTDDPGGTITFLFTDIEGSTRLLKWLGEDYALVLGEHHRLFADGTLAVTTRAETRLFCNYLADP